MLIQAINGFSKSKTQTVSSQRYALKSQHNISDSVSFGTNLRYPKITKKTQELLEKVAAKGKELAVKNPHPENTNGLSLNLKEKWAYIWPFDNAFEITLIMFNSKKTRNHMFINIYNNSKKMSKYRTGNKEKSIEFAEFYDNKKYLNRTIQKYLNLFLKNGTQHRNDLSDLEP